MEYTYKDHIYHSVHDLLQAVSLDQGIDMDKLMKNWYTKGSLFLDGVRESAKALQEPKIYTESGIQLDPRMVWSDITSKPKGTNRFFQELSLFSGSSKPSLLHAYMDNPDITPIELLQKSLLDETKENDIDFSIYHGAKREDYANLTYHYVTFQNHATLFRYIARTTGYNYGYIAKQWWQGNQTVDTLGFRANVKKPLIHDFATWSFNISGKQYANTADMLTDLAYSKNLTREEMIQVQNTLYNLAYNCREEVDPLVTQESIKTVFDLLEIRSMHFDVLGYAKNLVKDYQSRTLNIDSSDLNNLSLTILLWLCEEI